MKKKLITKLNAYILPDYNPSINKHFMVNINHDIISDFSLFMTTNRLWFNGTISFIETDHSKFFPFIMNRPPPAIRIVAEEHKNIGTDEKPEFVFDSKIFDQLFFIDKVKTTNIEMAQSSRPYLIELDLVSSHIISFLSMKSNYSNHDKKWSELDFKKDIDGIFNHYGESVFINSDDVFGIESSKLKRRCLVLENETTVSALNRLINSIYTIGEFEFLTSINDFDSNINKLTASELVGYIIDIDTNKPSFYRLNCEEKYAFEVKERKYLQKIVPLRFEHGVLNKPVSIAVSPNSKYSSILTNFGLNHVHYFHENFFNTILSDTNPNFFSNKTNLLNDSTDVLKPVDEYLYYDDLDKKELIYKSISNKPQKPVSVKIYDEKNLESFVQANIYSGLNFKENFYDSLINEVLTNNVIYVSLDNQIGHKVGQIINIVVQESANNSPHFNYNLNLAFAGAWRIVSVKWIFKMTEDMVEQSEVLGLLRMSKLIGDESMLTGKGYLIDG